MDKAAYKKAWRIKNRVEIKIKDHEYFMKNRDTILAQNRAYYANNRDRMKVVAKAYRDRPENKEKQKIRHRRRHIRIKYGLSPEQFDKIFDAQDRKCLICETDQFGCHGPVIDHCHNAGHIRGILCQRCNALVGMARNSPRILHNAMKYLAKELIFN